MLVATAGHLHPGGLYTDLKVRRRGKTAPLFRSRAKYFEPAGAVSWDVAMTATPRDWRVKLRRGDVLSTSATYDTSRAAWWESMGIMVAYMARGGPGDNPFTTKVNRRGAVTHGHLPENDNHGGGRTGLPDPRTLPDGAENPGFVDLLDFKYQLGDLSLAQPAAQPAGDPRGADAHVPRRGRQREEDLPLDHLVQAALQPLDGHRVPDRGQQRAVRVGHARNG